MIAKCKICNSKDRVQIEEMLDSNIPYSQICERFPDMNENNISRHKKHMISDAPERLQELINRALRSDLPVENISDLVKLLDHQKRYEEAHYGDCSQCEYKQNAPTYALQRFLGEEDSPDILENATIISGIDGKRYTAKEYLGEDKTMSDEEYKKYRKQHKIDNI